MAKKRVVVHAECPACAGGDVSFIPPEKMREKIIGNHKEIDILCTMCGTKTTGRWRKKSKRQPARRLGSGKARGSVSRLPGFLWGGGRVKT